VDVYIVPKTPMAKMQRDPERAKEDLVKELLEFYYDLFIASGPFAHISFD
jgi:hypothetical protein